MGAENKPTEQATAVIGTFVLISGGTFEMGSPDTENWRLEDEVGIR